MNIQIISNKENRLEQFKPVFLWMKANNLCKIDTGYVIVPTTLTLNPNSQMELAFKMIQEYSRFRGFHLNCYQYGEI